MTIGAVVPVYNRKDNLELLLLSLEQQNTNDFVVVIADDGSTDGTAQMVQTRAQSSWWRDRLRWVGCGPSAGVRTGRARNIGAANLPPDITSMIMLDSDLILRPEAVDNFAQAATAAPDLVLLGLVDWLPPLDRGTVEQAVTDQVLAELRLHVPSGTPRRIEGTFAGTELRLGLFDIYRQTPTPLRPEWALPLNSVWPLDLYWSVGGFDESLIGYGYQDMDLGARASRAGVRCEPHDQMWALHVWHPKPGKAMGENQTNLDRYLRRHGHNDVIATDVDWTLWFHYHADRGGTLARLDEQLWAVNGTHDRRLALPDESWAIRLGHCGHLLGDVNEANLAGLENQGVARL